MLRRMMRSLAFVVIVGALSASLATGITGVAEIDECKGYLTGIGKTVDLQKAMQCFESKESPVSKGYVAYMHFTGRWVKEDKTKGNEIFTTVKARIEADCNKGIGDACFLMGIYTSEVLGTKKDYQKEMEWYLKAADKGEAGSMTNIGFLYDKGHGVKQDYQKAMEWYLKAADKGEANAIKNIGNFFTFGRGVMQDYQKAMEWYLKAADKGEVAAIGNIGVFFAHGEGGVKQDYQKAMEWYLKAADKGEANAMRNIGDLYANGQGVKQDYQKAMEWYLKAADKGEAIAMTNVGYFYGNGQGVKKDENKAKEWYTKAEVKENKGIVAANDSIPPHPSIAEIKTFVKEYTCQANDEDSRNSCKIISLRVAKRLLLDELCTYIEGQTEVKNQNFQMTKDQITTLTAGILSADVLEDKWDGKVYWLKAIIVANPQVVMKDIDNLRKNIEKVKELEELRKKSEELLRENERLNKELKVAKGAKKKEVLQSYKRNIDNLSSIEWFERGSSAESVGNVWFW